MFQVSELPLLAGWQNFYFLVGAAAATLTGLMFIVITLSTNLEGHADQLDAGISGFITPAIVHFGAVLLIAAILSMPWQSIPWLSILLGLIGLAGIIYLTVVMRILGNQPKGRPPVHDWVWYAVLPLIPYVMLVAAAALLLANMELPFYLIAAGLIALLFVSLRNAWDLVTFMATARNQPRE